MWKLLEFGQRLEKLLQASRGPSELVAGGRVESSLLHPPLCALQT
jgi:hypothetical protein